MKALQTTIKWGTVVGGIAGALSTVAISVVSIATAITKAIATVKDAKK